MNNYYFVNCHVYDGEHEYDLKYAVVTDETADEVEQEYSTRPYKGDYREYEVTVTPIDEATFHLLSRYL